MILGEFQCLPAPHCQDKFSFEVVSHPGRFTLKNPVRRKTEQRQRSKVLMAGSKISFIEITNEITKSPKKEAICVYLYIYIYIHIIYRQVEGSTNSELLKMLGLYQTNPFQPAAPIYRAEKAGESTTFKEARLE